MRTRGTEQLPQQMGTREPKYDQGRTIVMSNTDGRTNDSSGISAAVIPGGKRTQQSNGPERSRVATSENPQQHSSIVHLRLPVTYGGMVALVRFPCMSTDICPV